MARLTDPHLLACYLEAFHNRAVVGYITLEGMAPAGLRRHLTGVTREGLLDLLHQHLVNGGEIDQVEETREPWRDFWEFHFDLRLDIGGILMYVETRMRPESPKAPEDATVMIVNIHPA